MAAFVMSRVACLAVAWWLATGIACGASCTGSIHVGTAADVLVEVPITQQCMPARATTIELTAIEADRLLGAGPALPMAVGSREGARQRANATRAASTSASTSESTRTCPVDLVREAQGGNTQAFSKLWQRYAPVVNSILLTVVQEPDADDLTQEVAVAALRALPNCLHLPALPIRWFGQHGATAMQSVVFGNRDPEAPCRTRRARVVAGGMCAFATATRLGQEFAARGAPTPRSGECVQPRRRLDRTSSTGAATLGCWLTRVLLRRALRCKARRTVTESDGRS